jgi:hypothetical protein
MRILLAFLLLGVMALPARAEPPRLLLAPVEGIFSFAPGEMAPPGIDPALGPVARPAPADVARLERFLDAADGATLLIVRGARVLREVSPDEDLYARGGAIPLVEQGTPVDERDAMEAPDRIDLWAIGAPVDLSGEVVAAAEGVSESGARAMLLTLTPEGSRMVERLGEGRRDRQLVALLGRDILAAPVVSAPLAGGTLMLSFASPEDPARQDWVADALRSLARAARPDG